MFDTKIYKESCECLRVFCEHKYWGNYSFSPLQHEIEMSQAYHRGYVEGRRMEEESNKWRPKTIDEQEVMDLLTSTPIEHLERLLNRTRKKL